VCIVPVPGETDTDDNCRTEPVQVGGSGNVTHRAVIVGIADYPGTVNDLNYTDDDAQDIHDALVARPEWTEGNIHMLFDSDASVQNIQSAINTMQSHSDDNDVCLFYFSGHGTAISDVDPFDETDGNDEALVAHDGFIPDDDLGDWFAGSPTNKISIIIDACFSGGLIKGPMPGVKTLRSSDRISAKGDGFASDLKKLLEAKDLDDNGTGVVLTACDDDELCMETGALQNGVWTYYVVDGMTQAGTDLNMNNWISAEEIYVYAAPLATAYYSDQHAQIYDGYPDELDILTVPGFQPDEVIAEVGCDAICEGDQVVIPIDIDMYVMSPPNDYLGAFTGTIDWNPAHLTYVSDSGILAGFTGIVNVSPGHIDFNGANPSGADGGVHILDVTFDVAGSVGQSGVIDLEFSVMAAANTFVDLLPFLNVIDCIYTIEPCGILGDVNGDEMVNSTDALIVLSCDVGIDVSQFCPMNCGDVNDDGFINSTDALIILSYDVGIPVPFPVGEPGCPQNVTQCPGCIE